MDIQEPEEAITYYDEALQKDPNDMALIREVGKALVMTHDYNRAIRYYEQTLQDDPKLFDLRADLAELYIKLKAFDEAKKVLIDALKVFRDMPQDIEMKARNVQTLITLSKVYLDEDMQSPDWKFKENVDAKQALIEASRIQNEVLDMTRDLASDRRDDERAIAAEIAFKLGKYYEERDGNLDDAISCFNDTLKRSNNVHKDAMVAIARINQSKGNNDACFQMCQKVIKIEPSNEEATYMLANLMLMKQQTDSAIQIYKSLLNAQPDNYNVLANLIELMRRAGKINDVQSFIENAELKTQRSKMAGLNYCKGLFSRYKSEPLKALRELNFSRFDNFYGESAI